MKPSRPSKRYAAGLAAVAITLGASWLGVSPLRAQETARPARGPLEMLGLATSVPEAKDFVRATRPDLETLPYMNIGTPRAEPKLPHADAKAVAAREKHNDALKSRRDALAGSRVAPSAPPRLPASALRAKAAHDAMMRERATGAR